MMDNLNTHKPSLLYKRYLSGDARRILKRLEIHDTPKHGSWSDIADIELNVMIRQCLSRCIAEIVLLRSEMSVWEAERNTSVEKLTGISPHFNLLEELFPCEFFHILVRIHLVIYITMAMNSLSIVKSFKIFENQTACLPIITDLKSMQPFMFNNRMEGLRV